MVKEEQYFRFPYLLEYNEVLYGTMWITVTGYRHHKPFEDYPTTDWSVEVIRYDMAQKSTTNRLLDYIRDAHNSSIEIFDVVLEDACIVYIKQNWKFRAE